LHNELTPNFDKYLTIQQSVIRTAEFLEQNPAIAEATVSGLP